MIRVVEIEPGGFGGQTLAPAWIVGEELAQMPLAHLLVVLSQGFPRRPRSQRGGCAVAVIVGSHSWTPPSRAWRSLTRCSPADPAMTCRKMRFLRAGAGSRAPHRPPRSA